MDCATSREALSAQLDGELTPVPADALDQHLVHCPACREWQQRSATLTRTLRVRVATTIPDFTDVVLAQAPVVARRWWPRVALGVTAVVQLTLGIAQVFGADQAMPGMAGGGHLFNESTAWNLALGLGMLWTALRTRAAAGMLPVMAGFLAVLTVFSVHDLLIGQVVVPRVALHGLLIVGLGLVYAVHHTGTGRRDPVPEFPDVVPVPRRSAAAATGLGAGPTREDVRPGDGPLRPTGRHHAA
ncbi:MAG: zf-HC2 domain-containing protein [Kutzneria sp.]|nr:zf-HC2 domain-containing protein [Kutzneria sp.]